jgi:membrane protease YdiL (CAAX protease family)
LVFIGAYIVAAFPAIAIFRAFGRDPANQSAQLDGVSSFANLVAQLLVLTALVGYLSLRHRGWRRTVRFPPLRSAPREIGIGLACGVGMTFVLYALVGFVLEPIFRAATGREVTPADQISPGINGWGAVAFFFAAVIVAPVVEELFFRGLFFRAVRDRYGFWFGALASGLLFGLFHAGAGDLAQNVMLQIVIGSFGVVLAAIYEWRGSLGANIATHAAFNLVTVIGVLVVVKVV